MRRNFIMALLAVLLIPVPAAAAEQKPYRVSLVGDAFAGDGWITGVRIEMADGWKTYWRMPGESGIPPHFTWTTSVPAVVTVSYPLPGRFADASGETVGYEREVVFPVKVEAGGASAVHLGLDLFFGVCKDICIPARASVQIALGPAMRDAAGSRMVATWSGRVPEAGTPVAHAEIDASGNRPMLRLVLGTAADDIFVESETAAYFGKPVFTADGRTAELAIDNIRDPARLAGAVLNITASTHGQGLEQAVVLP